MRQSRNEAYAKEASRNMLYHVDFHDFLEKESIYNDVEMAQEFQISVRDVQLLRYKMKR